MTEHLDVVIVGAGISGISTAWHLQDRCPTKSYAILERRENIGGTWDLFKYPGIRSDSDMFTLGFRFKPWTSAKAIADGPSIWNYINEAAPRTASTSTSAPATGSPRWTGPTPTTAGPSTSRHGGERKQLTASFLSVCSGYYNYDEGYSPEFPGAADFKGQIIHPQHWPEDLDYAGKKIVVIGSGATAITLIPSLVNEGAGHVTMLQRSPTYIGALPLVDPVAAQANKYLPKNVAHVVNRWKAIAMATGQYQLARRFPKHVQEGAAGHGDPAAAGRLRLREALQPRATTRGMSESAWRPTAISSRPSRSGKADVVTDTIETVHRDRYQADLR